MPSTDLIETKCKELQISFSKSVDPFEAVTINSSLRCSWTCHEIAGIVRLRRYRHFFRFRLSVTQAILTTNQ